VRPQNIELLRRDYAANGGWETFLSYEDPEADILVGLLRLRKCSEDGTYRKELVGMDGGCSLVRELHVYGTAAPVHSRDPKKFQHQVSFRRFSNGRRADGMASQGIGTLLMEEAKRIAREEHGSGRIAVISGVFRSSFTAIPMLTTIQASARGTTIDEWDTSWTDRTWSRTCCMMTEDEPCQAQPPIVPDRTTSTW